MQNFVKISDCELFEFIRSPLDTDYEEACCSRTIDKQDKFHLPFPHSSEACHNLDKNMHPKAALPIHIAKVN